MVRAIYICVFVYEQCNGMAYFCTSPNSNCNLLWYHRKLSFTSGPLPGELLIENLKVNQVDIFSIVFMIVGVPVGIFGIYIIDKIGLKWSMWVAVTCNTIGPGSSNSINGLF